MTKIKLSLCIPTYNRLSDLKRCVDSIISGFKDYPYELIIADGGSNDGTLNYLRNLNKNNIKIIEQGKLTGITKAYNESFKIATGDYVYIGNDDTVLFPEIFIKSCELMDREKQIGLVAPKDKEPLHGNLPAVTLKLKKYWALLSKFHIFRHSVLKEIGYYDENLKSYYTDDDSCLSVLSRGYTIAFTKEVGMIHYREPYDVDQSKARKENLKENEIKKEQEYLDKKWKNLTEYLNDYIKNNYIKTSRQIYFTHYCSKAYHSKTLQMITPKFLYDFFLEQSVIFNDKEYSNLKDYYLIQRYPEVVINRL